MGLQEVDGTVTCIRRERVSYLPLSSYIALVRAKHITEERSRLFADLMQHLGSKRCSRWCALALSQC